MVNKLSNLGCDSTAGIFLGAFVGTCLTKMKKISKKYPKLNNGVTELGSNVMNLIEAQQKNQEEIINQ